MSAVLRHQEPAGKARLNDMITGTGGRLCDLTHHHIEITLEVSLQDGASSQFAAKARNIHAKRPTFPLHYSVKWRYVHAQYEGDAKHALVPDQTHFQVGGVIQRLGQRNEAFRGKVDITNALPGFAQDLRKRQFDWLATSQEAPALLTRQCCKQLVVSLARFCKSQLNSPVF